MTEYLQNVIDQPSALKHVLEYYRGCGAVSLKAVRDAYHRGGYRSVLLTGMGSSLFACQVAVNYLNERGITAWSMDAADLLYYNLNGVKEDILLVAVSQSGVSVELTKLLSRLPAGLPLVGVTNVPSSPLGQRADFQLPIQVSPDRSVAVKTYTASVLILWLLSDSLAGEDERHGDHDQAAMAIKAMGRVIEDLETRLGQLEAFVGLPTFVHCIGRGPSFSSAQEGALLFKEGAKIYAEGISGGQFRHGSIEVVQEGHLGVLFAPAGRSHDLNCRLAGEMVEAAGRVVFVSPAGPGFSHERLLHVPVEAVDEHLAPLPEIVPLQLLVSRLAARKGFEAGDFFNTVPVITKE
ncbi:MAG: SIS domain-containing protein [Bacillota bacterium]